MNSKLLILSLGILSVVGCSSGDSPFTQGGTTPSSSNIIDAGRFSLGFSTPAPAVLTLANPPVNGIAQCADLDSIDGTPTTDIVVTAADQDGNAVSSGTVYFEVEYGILKSNSCELVAGTCKVEWEAQVNIDLLTTAVNTLDCFNDNGTIDVLNSVTAWTYGAEHFIDNDGDGMLSDAETFTDTDDPYLDRNDNGSYDPATDNLVVPADSTYDAPNVAYDGPNCDSTTRGDCGGAALKPVYVNLFMVLGQ